MRDNPRTVQSVVGREPQCGWPTMVEDIYFICTTTWRQRRQRTPPKTLTRSIVAGNDTAEDSLWSDRDHNVGVRLWRRQTLRLATWRQRRATLAKDFDTLSAAGIIPTRGAFGRTGTTMWVADFDDNKLYAYSWRQRRVILPKTLTRSARQGMTIRKAFGRTGPAMWVADDSRLTNFTRMS